MAGESRVAWREGAFLRPQHFQQQDRFVEALVETRAAALSPYPWGVRDLVFNQSLLQLGKFGIERCTAILPDGTVVRIPGDAPPPPPIDVPVAARDALIHLTLPARQPGAVEFATADSDRGAIRFLVEEEAIHDAYADERLSEEIELARPNLAFGMTAEHTEGRVTLALARVREVDAGRVILDEQFIPPTLDARGSERLKAMVTDIMGRADQRVEELSVRAVEATRGGAETFASFLLLQALNRWSPVLAHQKALPALHPERLYETFVSMAGELSTLALPQRRPPVFPTYDHENLQGVFQPPFELLQAALSMEIARSAGQLTLESVGPGAYTARVDDHGIFQNGSLYLAARASAPPEAMLARFASLVKLGPVTRMREIVSSALQAGVRITPTPTPPPQLRVQPGYLYFELDRSSPDWPELTKAPAIGLHVAGDWPDLELELWWVKRSGS
jgi:type VI secretion system protein ImpJ